MDSERRPPAGRPRRKRADGQGSVNLWRRDDAGRPLLYRGRIMLGHKDNGKPDVRYVYAPTERAAYDKLDDLKAQHRSGALVEPSKKTVTDYLREWLHDHRPSVEPNTAASYGSTIERYLVPALGTKRLTALRAAHIKRCFTELTARPLSTRTVRLFRTILRMARKEAVILGLLAQDPTDGVKAPKQQKTAASRTPTPAEMHTLLRTAQEVGDRLEAVWTVAYYTGCRPGELLALKWEDINLEEEEGTLTIRRRLLGTADRRPVFGEHTKTGAKGDRTITVSEDVVAALRRHRERQDADKAHLGEDYLDYGLLFATGVGAPLIHRNVTRAFKRLLRRAGLPETIRFYDLRHGNATALLVAGVPAKVVAERLGHSSIQVTLDTYSHVLPELDRDAAARLQRVVRPTAPDEDGGEA